MSARPAVHLHINEVVLHGFDPGDRRALGAALQRELAAVIAREGIAPSLGGGEVQRLDGGSFRVSDTPRPVMTAVGIARAVHGSLRR